MMTSMGRNLGRLGLALLLAWAGGVGARVPSAWPVGVQPPALAPPALLAGPLASSGGPWIPTFDDEFDGPAVDQSKWSNGFGWGDTADNFAAVCDPGANAVANGVLVQRADRLPAPRAGKAFSGGCLHTRRRFAQLYGYWEARIRVPAGSGLHSAFWGKPANEAWPPELDVEEIGGDRPDTVIMTAHWHDGTGHRSRNQRYRSPGFSDDFHVFGAEWSPDETVWYVDGVERARIGDGAPEMAAQGPFYALLDLQVGLAGAARPDASTPFPAYQLVDYVRIWQRPSGMLTG
jgi:beta-glucanase (GH16 family)